VSLHPAHALHCDRNGAGLAQPSALRVIELYQGLVRPFQRCGKAYELRCGNFTHAQLRRLPADGSYAGPGKSHFLADTCMVPRFTRS
jgi:hypothetical protein